MNRIDRLQAILTRLQSKRVVKAEELATRFEVSIRTIYRDIRALELGGVPIGAEAGIGYFLEEGYHIPPVMFNHDEARALLLAGKMVAQFTDETIGRNYQDALTKVKSVLDMGKKDDLESLEKDIIVNPFPNEKKTTPDDLNLDLIKRSLSESKVINIHYSSKGKGEETQRDLEPVGLCYYYGGWHLIAFCRLRNDYRDFRLDRIYKLIILPQSYSRFKHPSLQDYINNLIQNTELMLCVIDVKKEVYKYVDEMKYHMGLVKEEEKAGIIRMSFATFGLEYFARWMLTMCASVTIVSPDDLITKTKVLVDELHSHYK